MGTFTLAVSLCRFHEDCESDGKELTHAEAGELTYVAWVKRSK
jgi:hypothetical protein